MLSRKIIIQVIVFAVVGVIAVAYGAMRYAGIGSSLLNPGYTVKLDLADSGGIFANAEVTYRGVTVGKVTGLELTDNGLRVDLHIDSSAPKIPSDSRASIADRSAVGEQYVDLVPNTADGPYLSDGSVVTRDRTSTPLPTQDLLMNLDTLVNSVPTDSLRTVVDELDNGFSGTGSDLQKLLDSTADLTKTAQAQLPQTTQLLQSGQVVLDTQNVESGAIASFSDSLEKLSVQLKSSDPDLRTLITNVPAASAQITDLLNESGPHLGAVLANLLTTANVVLTREAGLREALVVYPLVAAGTGTTVPGDGTAHLGLVLNVFNPPPCTNGYQGTPARPGNDLSQAKVNTQAYCAEPQGSPIDVRGAQHAPGGGMPTTATAGSGAESVPGQGQPAGGVNGLGGADSGATLTSMAQLLGVG